MASSKKVKFSIIILSWNTKELLRQCLESVIRDTRYVIRNTEIIVVDNGSEDGSVELINGLIINELTNSKRQKTKGLSIKLIENKENFGFAKGNNQALRQAQGEYVMLLNSDTVVQKGAIEKLVEFLDSNPEVGAVSPLVLNKDGSTQKDPCYLKFPSILLVLFYYNRFFKRLALICFPQILFSAVDFRKPVEVDQLPGAALIVRKSILDKVRGFDEDYQLYFEDTDFCWRIKELGYKLMIVPLAKITHLGRKSIEPVIKKEGVEKFYFLNFSSLFSFCNKHYPLWKSILIKMIVFLHLASTFKFQLIYKLMVFNPKG